MAEFIAAFNKDVVRTDVVSETNAVTYKFRIGGATNASPNPFLYRNNEDLLNGFVDGLNVREFNAVDGTPGIKSFNFSTTAGNSINSGFISYLNSSNLKLIILFSGKNMRSASDIDSWFKSVGSVAWPGSFMCNNYSCGYVGIYSPSLKKIVAEVAKYTDGNDTGLAEYTCVYDVFEDLGSLGMPNKLIYDGTEYTSSSGGVYKDYLTTNLSNFNIGPGNQLLLTADMYKAADNIKNQLRISWFNEGTLIDQSIIECDSSSYKSYEQIFTIPANTTRIYVSVTKTGTEKAGIKNVTLTQATLIENTRTAFMGVNGIKASKFVEYNEDHLLDLNLQVTTEKNIVPVINIQEANGAIKYDLDLTTINALPSWLGLSRLSKATMLNNSGKMIEVDNDIARFGYTWDGSQWKNRGLLLEKQSTNYIRSSFDVNVRALAQPSFNKKDSVINPLDSSRTSCTISRTSAPGNWLLLAESNPVINTPNGFTVSSYFSFGSFNQFGYRMDTYKNQEGANNSLVYGVTDGNQAIKKFPTYNFLSCTVPSSSINAGNVYVGSPINPQGNVGDSLTVHTWQLESLPYASSFIITPHAYNTREADNLYLNIPGYTGTIKLVYTRNDNNLTEIKWIDVKNNNNFIISNQLDVGVDLTNIVVYDYLLSEAEKRV